MTQRTRERAFPNILTSKYIVFIMKSTFVTTALLFLISQFIVAQTTGLNPMDEVYLQSGQVYRGIIIEQKPGASIRLWRTAESDTLLLEMEDIERIVKVFQAEKTPTSGSDSKKPTITPVADSIQPNRWATAIQAYIGGGDHSVGGVGLAIHRRLGLRHSWLGLGLSYIGDVNEYGTSSIAVYAHGSHEFSTGSRGHSGSSGFLDLGYSVNLGGEYLDAQQLTTYRYGNGLHLYTGLRFRLSTLNKGGLWLDMGYLRHSSVLRLAENNTRSGNKAWHAFVFRGSVYF